MLKYCSCGQDKRTDTEGSTDLPDEWSRTGRRDKGEAQLGCWRERGSVSDQLPDGVALPTRATGTLLFQHHDTTSRERVGEVKKAWPS